MVCKPCARPVGVNDHTPLALAVVVPSTVEPSLISPGLRPAATPRLPPRPSSRRSRVVAYGAVAGVIALLIFFGFFPQPLLNIINPAVSHTLVQVHATDPVPPHPAPAVLSGHAATPRGDNGLPPVAALPSRASGLPAAPVTISHRQKGTTP